MAAPLPPLGLPCQGTLPGTVRWPDGGVQRPGQRVPIRTAPRHVPQRWWLHHGHLGFEEELQVHPAHGDAVGERPFCEHRELVHHRHREDCARGMGDEPARPCAAHAPWGDLRVRRAEPQGRQLDQADATHPALPGLAELLQGAAGGVARGTALLAETRRHVGRCEYRRERRSCGPVWPDGEDLQCQAHGPPDPAVPRGAALPPPHKVLRGLPGLPRPHTERRGGRLFHSLRPNPPAGEDGRQAPGPGHMGEPIDRGVLRERRDRGVQAGLRQGCRPLPGGQTRASGAAARQRKGHPATDLGLQPRPWHARDGTPVHRRLGDIRRRRRQLSGSAQVRVGSG
mmetsp:Transcript_33330/g.75538  ORF Transcript_33330/g.75538 Transcript_33330/m.75538 type:complete len:341 (-) Transcript_33330:40-1062(-)